MATIEPAFDVVAAHIQSVLVAIATLIQPVFDPVALHIKPLLGLVTTRPIHPLVNSPAPRIQMLIDAFSAGIKVFVDALATRVQSLVGAIAAILGHGWNGHQGQQSRSDKS
ncbi:MAG: hypothetical protein ABI616_06695 [Pseudomonadota bacterium]